MKPDSASRAAGRRTAAGAAATTTYASSGVDLAAADEMVDRIAPLVRRTFGPRVLGDLGGFAGAFRLDFDERLFARNYRSPVLVACTDGVGSKVLVAAHAGRYDTVGIDLVAMSVNDLLTTGGEPLFFLDYVAVNKLDPARLEQIVSGVVRGCEEAGCALLGGETAEMPDLYQPGHFDLAGFAVGVVERRRMMSPRLVRPGDELLGLASSGVHSNGYALVRRLLLREAGLSLSERLPSLNETLADALLRPTRIYVRPVLDALRRYRGRPRITGMAHITGGGLPGNLPRMLPPDCDIVVRRGSWPQPPIFGLISRYGVAEEEMHRVFNMGIGYALAVRPKSAGVVGRALERSGEQVYAIGRVRRGRGRVEMR
ncbi:MAG: phosphoribosylformylglycinamidine cyclo-ligase [Phycisphaerae bacterium]|nr:phosphoribosylformylglycinamidine cyclo-ligase [Phycisphaerae bacterium]MCZ2399672.1 phosphoribosylformylglycinamidine cyclo-ligase [Phycisphaerae bacterium]NUQ49485.1 phosphoribosylformylglycinamidine cyclo-ligase [Phycisphaerae bacterium]